MTIANPGNTWYFTAIRIYSYMLQNCIGTIDGIAKSTNTFTDKVYGKRVSRKEGQRPLFLILELIVL